MNKIITFGEVLMRISPRGNKKFIQSNNVEFYFGGTEVNVGISIANFGGNVKHISCISNDFIGNTAISYLALTRLLVRLADNSSPVLYKKTDD